MKKRSRHKKTENSRGSLRLWAAAVWLLAWELLSIYIGQEILLVSPVSVLIRLLEFITGGGQPAAAAQFWSAAAFSFVRIIGGFLAASAAGVLLACLAGVFRPVRDLLAPAMTAIKAVPVASFIILVLIWVPSRNLSVVISFLMVLPIVYTNVLNGIRSMDGQLLEMARVFRVPLSRRIRFIYLSQLLPFLRTAFPFPSACAGTPESRPRSSAYRTVPSESGFMRQKYIFRPPISAPGPLSSSP